MRPTQSQLAEAAGVSTATVDRVLNGRSGVSARTRQIVHNAARQIGYLPDDQPSGAPKRLIAILPKGNNDFIDDLRAHLTAEAAIMQGVTLDLPKVSGLEIAATVDALGAARDTDGIAVVAQSHPRVHDALLRLSARKVPVVTLLSDLPDTLRHAYVGIDNLRAGRLAGEVITRFLGPNPTGQIALFAGALAYRGHQEREVGLRQYLAEEAPELTILDIRESGDDPDRAFAQAADKLRDHPGLAAIYNAGGGTTGIARALQDAGRADTLIFVAHEATEANKALLLDGTLDAIIDQNAKREAQETLRILLAAARGTTHPPTQPLLHLILRENIPSDVIPTLPDPSQPEPAHHDSGYPA
ncbi:LacI family DNA-binding transcriptional regulator [Jannaschia sp. CCS1]|uniref:LacI family DNA-binding transcriptional regulator n=1 Tax=Jannaschia sp. (strain CCS1) TaxID=290400 RepID=UPI000053A6EA|nr:LacI family DNA-binding transcriptional regulator [Jannaschia sp. CCS1]ABD54372.1 transcriptional regulator, LacI family [Jannaschia sp. CCS1]